MPVMDPRHPLFNSSDKIQKLLNSDQVSAVTGGATESVLDSLLGIPEVLARAGLGASNVGNAVLGNEQVRVPEGESLLGLPSGRDVLSGADRVAGLLGGQTQSFQGAQDARQQVAEQNPMLSAFGGISGDALTLMTGRAPFLPKSGKTDILAPPIKKALEKLFSPGASDKMSRVAGRTLEGGIEGATLALINGGDPVETGLYSAASQTAGLAGLALGDITGVPDLLKGRFKKGGTKLGLTAFAMGSLLQFLKSGTPGGDDSVISSIESGFDKIPLALTLGALGGLTGAGRKGDNLPLVKAKLGPILKDTFSTLPRAGTLQAVRSILEDETGASEQALQKILRSPEVFSESQQKSLESGLSGDFAGTVGKMMEEDEQFRAAVQRPFILSPVED